MFALYSQNLAKPVKDYFVKIKRILYKYDTYLEYG